MKLQASPVPTSDLLPLRTRYRQESNWQIIHDSIHRRDGWTVSYLLQADGCQAGFGSLAIAGPWKDKPTVGVEEKFELLSENPMSERIIASPVPVANRLLLRGDHNLICVGGAP